MFTWKMAVKTERERFHYEVLCDIKLYVIFPCWTRTVVGRHLHQCLGLRVPDTHTPTARVGSGVERIGPLYFLAGCRNSRLNQALSVLSSLGFFECVCCGVN